jgi:hypothetical protein
MMMLDRVLSTWLEGPVADHMVRAYMGGDRAESVLILVLDQVPSANNGLVQRASV